MKSKLLLAFTAGFLFCSTQQKAQVSNYSFTQTLSTYGSPNTGSVVGLPFQDDDITNVSLPFNFTFNGTSYNNVNVCSNGHLSFSPISGLDYGAVSSSTTQNVVSAFGTDLLMGVLISADLTTGSNTLTNCSSVAGYSVGDILFDYNSDFASNPVITLISGNNIVVNTPALSTISAYDVANSHGYIKQSVSGTSPNQICEFEFRNFSRFFIYDELVNFKVRLYQTTNKIEFVYGIVIPGTDITPSEVGLKGLSNTDYNSRKVNSPTLWSNSTAATSITDYCDFDSSIFPANGQSYMWTPVSCTVPVLAIAATSTAVCSGQQVVLTGSGATTYSWTNGPATAQNSVTPGTTTSYTLIGANSTCTSSLVKTISVTPSPTLNVAQSSPSTCVGQTSTITASGATSYSLNGVATTSQFTVSPSATTTYTIGASNGNCAATQTIMQTIVSSPILTLATTKNELCAGESATLSAYGATSFTWSSSTSTSVVNSYSIVTSAPGSYTVMGSNGSGACSGTVLKTIGVADCTGINETAANAANNISAYPNPFNGVLYVKNTADKDQSVVISDALGKVIYRATIKAGSTESISAEALNSGIYFISVKGENGTFTKKLIKE